MDNKVPVIRFKGFSREWEEINLGDISDKITEKNTSLIYSETFTNSAEFGIINQRDYFDKDISNINNIIGYYIVQPEDFVYNPRISTLAPCGPINRNALGRTGIISPLYTVFRTKGVNTIFIEYFFCTQLWHMFMFFNGDTGARSDRFSIKDTLFFGLPLQLPTIEEQTAIGNYFQKLDTLINQHQQKHDQLSNIKKAMLEKMFPKQGETMPEIRLRGFSGEWEEKTISELFNITRGNVLSTMQISPIPTFSKCYPVYSSQTKNNGLMGFYDKYLFENAITWTTDGANAGTVNFRNGKFYSTNVNGVLLSDKGYANNAIAEILNKEAWKYVSHVGNPKLMNNVMSTIKITIPNSIEEQTAIGNFFQKLDTLINQHQQQITKLNNIKQACLSKMFV
ncbi:restriction endonuclease subunit S [Orbaceae bacterium ESL0721]|nr:restriction endonuclease subunit S [Orbaceae bacterium ESL0721]